MKTRIKQREYLNAGKIPSTRIGLLNVYNNEIAGASKVWQWRRKKIDTVTHVQFLDEAVCISLCGSTLGRGMNPTAFPLAKVKK